MPGTGVGVGVGVGTGTGAPLASLGRSVEDKKEWLQPFRAKKLDVAATEKFKTTYGLDVKGTTTSRGEDKGDGSVVYKPGVVHVTVAPMEPDLEKEIDDWMSGKKSQRKKKEKIKR